MCNYTRQRHSHTSEHTQLYQETWAAFLQLETTNLNTRPLIQQNTPAVPHYPLVQWRNIQMYRLFKYRPSNSHFHRKPLSQLKMWVGYMSRVSSVYFEFGQVKSVFEPCGGADRWASAKVACLCASWVTREENTRIAAYRWRTSSSPSWRSAHHRSS